MSERLLTTRELADLLGFAPATIVDWFEAGKLQGFRVGGRLRFRLSEVEAWLEDRRGPLAYVSADLSLEADGERS